MSHASWNEDRDLRDALDELAQAEKAAPDMTRSIMGRLGYMRVSPAVARRKLMMQWANRAGMLAVCGVAVALGWRVFESSPQVRRANETTLPQAISHDARQQTQRIDSMLQTIRQIASPKFTPRLGQQYAPDRSPRGASGRGNVTRQPAPGSMGAPFSADTVDEGGASRSDPLAPLGSPDPTEPLDLPNDRIDHSNGQQLREDLNRDEASSVRWA